MDKKTATGLIILAFLIGLSLNMTGTAPETEMPIGIQSTGMAPSNWIPQEKIHVYRNYIQIDLKDAVWANFTDTKSMIPVLSTNSNAIQIKPKTNADIKTGDIISFRNKINQRRIIHRVIGMGYDSEGKYFITKGDNNIEEDPFKVRFEDIERIVVAVIY